MVNMRIKVLKLSIVYVVFESVKKNKICSITWIAMQRLSNSVSVMQRKQSARLGSSWVRGSRPGCGTW